MLQSLRPFLTKILNPIARNLNINPNIVTVISPFVAVVAAYGYAHHLLILGTIAILFSGLLDVIDGAVARYHNRSSKFGAFLDSTMDRFADAIIYIGIIFGGYQYWNCRKGSSYDHFNGWVINRIFCRRHLLYIHHLHTGNIILLYCRTKNSACLEAIE